jgi:hypothetical protein
MVYGFLLKLGVLQNPYEYIMTRLIPNVVKARQEQQRTRGDKEKDKDLIQLMLDAMAANDAKSNGTNNSAISQEMSLKVSLNDLDNLGYHYYNWYDCYHSYHGHKGYRC